jgi:tripartite-type tricarboxylate transporter receptor subunit TctC
MRARVSNAVMAAVCCAALARPALAQDPIADFYKGKNLTVQVGYSAGGGYDITTRLVARHLGKHIPGNPTVIVSNMPGGGSIVLANYMYAAAPKDGSMLGVFGAAIMLEPLFGNPIVKVDAAKFNWIGNMHADINSCGIWKGGGADLKTYDQIVKHGKTIVFGSTSPEAETARFPVFLRQAFGAPFKVVNGYKGTREINLAMQTGEAHATCGMYESSVRGSYMDNVRSGELKIFFQAGLDRKVELFGDAVSIGDLIAGKGEEMRQIAELIFRPSEITRPIAAPPGTPPERVAALRKAFDATMKDPELIADGKKISLDFLPMTGQRVAELMTNFYKATPEMVRKAVALGNEPQQK